MARYLCLVALVSFIAVCAAQDQQQQCKQEFKKFHQCIKKSKASSSEEGNKKSEHKQQFEQCFTKNGCTAPKKPQGGPGGRQGPNPEKQCFKNIKQKLEGPFKQCLQQKGVSLPEGGHDGPGGKYGPPHGGPGGPGGPHGGPGGPPGPLLAQACNNDSAKVQQVQACLQQLKPTKEEAKVKYDEMCKVKNTCQQQSPISQSCKDQMQKFGQAMCECMQQLKPQCDQAFKEEPSCANVQKPPQHDEQKDCSKPHQNPCEQGFEAFYQQITSHGQPPAQPPPK